jgi:acyl carrier protein
MKNIGSQPIEKQLKNIISSVIKINQEKINESDSLTEDLNIDSIQFLEILSIMEEYFDFELDLNDVDFDELNQVHLLIKLVKRKLQL